MKIFNFGCMTFLIIASNISAQYSDHQKLATRLSVLDQKEAIVTASSIIQTSEGRNVNLVILGKGDADNKPGIAVIGGIMGYSPASTEIVMQMVEKMSAQKPAILDDVTFYFFPDVSPDASAQYFADPKYEREENARPYDDDRDGKTDEDGYDDMNGDGLITWMRIKDPDKGEFVVHPDNASVMVLADLKKNQNGEYIVIREGFDNDKDDRLNEDLPGGVIFNRNFSFNYPYFDHGAGENSFSDPVTRAVAKYLFDHWNIFAILCIGPENNLSEFTDLEVKLKDTNIPAKVHEKDKSYYERVVNLYNKMVTLNDSLKVTPSGGDLLSWAYFQYNRFAFSTPAWNIGYNKNNLGSREFDYLNWASDHGLPDQTVPWQKITHPDYPDKEVEIGGIKPFLIFNPPVQALDTVSSQHLDFLIVLASMHPALTCNDIKITRRSENLYLLEVEITNTGKFPAMNVLAAGSNWVKKVRVDISTSKTQSIAGGRKAFLYDNIVPGEAVKAAWLVNGKGKITLKAGSPQTGYILKDIELN